MKYNEMSAVRRLTRNGVTVRGVSINLDPTNQFVGIKLLGAIDYLVNHCHYFWIKEEKKNTKSRRKK